MMRQLLIIFTLFFICNTSFSQKSVQFEDAYGIQGILKYTGTVSDTALPKSGPYELRWREVEPNSIKTYFVKGITKNHLPTGKWLWEEANWVQQINIGTNILPSIQSTGLRNKWDGNFQNGLPHGKWIFTIDSMKSNGQVAAKILRIELSYANGKPSGMLKVDDYASKNKLKVVGQNSNSGLATGLWKFNYTDFNGLQVQEERTYKDGLILELKKTKGEKTFEEKFNYNIDFVKNQKANDSTVLIGQINFEQDEKGGNASELLHENFRMFFLNGWKLGAFAYEATIFPPFFKRLEYPINAEEKVQIAQLQEMVQLQQEEIASKMVDHMSIYRSRSEELDSTVAYLELVQERLNQIDSFLERTTHPFFTYKQRKTRDFPNFLEAINENRSAQGEVYFDLKVELPTLNSLSEKAIFGELETLLVQQNQTLSNYLKVIEEAHLSLKQESELHQLEEEILVSLKNQQEFYKDHEGFRALIFDKWIGEEIPQLLKDYARADEYNAALKIGQKIVAQLDSLEAWQESSVILDKANSLLTERYTAMVYNPYTGALDIPMTVKKRFFSSIKEILWPHLTDQLRESNTWEKWNLAWSQQVQVFNYLMTFATMDDKESKKVEKKIRKENKPERMLRAIENHIEQLEKEK